MGYYYCYYSRQPGPLATFLTVLGAVVFIVAFFFLAIPVFLAALTVFSGVALYVGWRMRRALKKMEKELDRQMRLEEEEPRYFGVIDIEKEYSE